MHGAAGRNDLSSGAGWWGAVGVGSSRGGARSRRNWVAVTSSRVPRRVQRSKQAGGDSRCGRAGMARKGAVREQCRE
jgi:hypothetical protein